MPDTLSAQDMYRHVRDNGWHIERIRRMKGTSLHITSSDHPGMIAGVFGYYGRIDGDIDGELAAWKALADCWNDDDFWHNDPDGVVAR